MEPNPFTISTYMKNIIIKLQIIFILSSLILIDCKSVTRFVEAGGSALESAAKQTRKTGNVNFDNGIRIKQIMQKGKGFLEIKFDSMPYITLYATEPNSRGRFELLQMKYLSGSYSGWNEFFMDISGVGFVKDTQALQQKMKRKKKETFSSDKFAIDGVPFRGIITNAAIKRSSTKIHGDRAVDRMKSRDLRIEAVVEWMHEQKDTPEFLNLERFENYWKPILLPELIKKRKRTALYNEVNSNSQKTDYKRSEEIKWNHAYTEKIFPQDLYELRDSGALLRDWEESIALFYVYYNWEIFFNTGYIGNR
ncbi:MAG: hypothetical protein Ta2F_03380 [Termitinemataceae bacterium]|nr:MAG: hypothetical protein Ta2F_03380 [Termitinemataceae bacterium]